MITAHMEKYSVPVINSIAIERKLIEHIMNSALGILFIHAPAGYGKTTSVIQWIASKQYMAAWFSIDYYDKTTAHFCRGILIALSIFADDKCTKHVQQVLNNSNFEKSPINFMLDLLAEFSFKSQPHMLVIDDFHLCDERTIAPILPLIRNRLPIEVKLIILSRSNPPYEVYDAIVKQKLKEITLKELSFCEKEIIAIFRENGINLSEHYAKRLYGQTLGWPAAISAVLLSVIEENKASGFYAPEINAGCILDNDSLYMYLKSNIYKYWDLETRIILMKTAVCDCIDKNLCLKLTRRTNSWEILTNICRKTGLLMKYKSNTYRYHQLLKDFLLLELENDEVIDKGQLYYNAALYYKDNCDLMCAFNMASKSGNIALAEDILNLNSYYGLYNIGIESYYELLNKDIVKNMSLKDIKKFPRLSLGKLFSLFIAGRLEEFNNISKLMHKYILDGDIHNSEHVILALLFFSINPLEDSWNVIKSFDGMFEKIADKRTNDKMPSFTLTFNMPFFHRAQRDYTDISPVLDKYLVEARELVAPIFGPVYHQLDLLLEAGVSFEKHDLKRAKAAAIKAVQDSKESSPEIKFSSLLLLGEIYRYIGNTVKTKNILNEIDKMIFDTKSFYLDANFDAYVTNQLLYSGDIEAAHKWLEVHTDIDLAPAFYQSYEKLTTARALMAVNNIKEAINVLNRISDMAENYNRNADFMEARTLLSMCLWNLKKNGDAVKCLINVLKRGYELEICMPIIKEGAGVVPILNKILNRLKHGYDSEMLNKTFVNFVFINAKKLAGHQKGLFAKLNDRPINLSKRQFIVLKMLSQKLTYKEISAELGIKVTSVREHVSKLYEKLEVSNASDAVLKASEKGILETD